MSLFGPIRQAALDYWANQTGRQIMDANGKIQLTDTFNGAYECDWQNKYPTAHVNLFCSLGDWACNLTDLLKDDRFDNFDFNDPEHAQVLFRFYTRLLLVLSELFTDFQDMYIQIKKLNPKRRENTDLARAFYFPGETPDRISRILNFINHTCKHKTQHLHVCNDHLPIYFQDNPGRKRALNYISVVDSTTAGKNAVLVPKLGFLIISILTCYRKINSYFRQNNADFKDLCSRFS